MHFFACVLLQWIYITCVDTIGLKKVVRKEIIAFDDLLIGLIFNHVMSYSRRSIKITRTVVSTRQEREVSYTVSG